MIFQAGNRPDSTGNFSNAKKHMLATNLEGLVGDELKNVPGSYFENSQHVPGEKIHQRKSRWFNLYSGGYASASECEESHF
jgi:hypothetical protein